MNAKAGKGNVGGATDKYELSMRDERDRLIESCQEHEFTVLNTCYKQPPYLDISAIK